MYDIIDQVIKKRKNKWKLKAITWFDFEDIYRGQGWKVKFDKSGYCESYDDSFEFTIK